MSRTETAPADFHLEGEGLVRRIARRWKPIVAVPLIVTAAAMTFAWLTPAVYTAQTRVIVEAANPAAARPDADVAGSGNLDPNGMLNQIQVITSSDILQNVASRLKLATRPEFNDATDMSVLRRALISVGLESDPRRVPVDERVLKDMRRRLDVYRVENTRVIAIVFSSRDRELAAAVPEAIAEAYIASLKNVGSPTVNTGTDVRRSHIAELTAKVNAAEAKVADLRSKSSLPPKDSDSSLATQQLSDITAELDRVRATRAKAESQAMSVKAVLDSHTSLDAISDILDSSLMQRLSEHQVQLRAQIANLSTTLLPNHPHMKALEAQLSDLNVQMRGEAERILQGLQNQAQAAKLREQQLTGQLDDAKAATSQADDQQADLDMLQQQAAAARDRLNSYLARSPEAQSPGQSATAPVEARIFSHATVPADSHPNRALIVIAAFLASLLIMFLVTLLQEIFRSRQAYSGNSTRFASVPQLVMPMARDRVAGEPVDREPFAAREFSVSAAARFLAENDIARAIVLSPEGDEGAASSILLAREMSDAGLRVLLLDLTSTGAASQPTLESEFYAGITNLLASEAQFTDVIHPDLYSDCHVMPVGTADPERAMRAADRLPIILNSLATAYDLVVIECGVAEPGSLGRLKSDDSTILVSVVEPGNSAVAATTAELEDNGQGAFILITPAGNEPARMSMASVSAA